MVLFFFPYIGNNHPNWLIFFRGVGIPPTSDDLYIHNDHQRGLLIRAWHECQKTKRPKTRWIYLTESIYLSAIFLKVGISASKKKFEFQSETARILVSNRMPSAHLSGWSKKSVEPTFDDGLAVSKQFLGQNPFSAFNEDSSMCVFHPWLMGTIFDWNGALHFQEINNSMQRLH